MFLLDFISFYKGSYEKVLLCFPFSKKNDTLYKFSEFDTSNLSRCEVLGFVCCESMIIVDLNNSCCS